MIRPAQSSKFEVQGSRFFEFRKWAGFVKFSHTVFALPFALASMEVAARDRRGWPGWRTFGLVLAAMVCARTCAMSFNRIVDRDFDKANPRTANRPLPTGEISLAGAWALCLLSGLALVVASWFINKICFYLSPVAILWVCFYSLTKRFTDFTHIYLGIALALAPIGAWLAVKGGFDFFPVENGWLVLKKSAFLPLILAGAVVFWLIGFDIIYALQDYEFDRRHGLHSLAGHHPGQSVARTLAGAPAQFEVDQHRVLSAQRAHQRGVSDGNDRRGGVRGRV